MADECLVVKDLSQPMALAVEPYAWFTRAATLPSQLCISVLGYGSCGKNTALHRNKPP